MKIIAVLLLILIVSPIYSDSLNVFDFSKTGDKDKVLEYLKTGGNINIQDKFGWTMLMYACKYNEIEMVRFLIDKGADVNIKDHKGFSIMEYIKTSKQDVRRNESGALAKKLGLTIETEVRENSEETNKEIREMIMGQSILSNESTLNLNKKMLDAIRAKDSSLVESLISKGADIYFEDISGSPLIKQVIEDENLDMYHAMLAKNIPNRLAEIFLWIESKEQWSNPSFKKEFLDTAHQCLKKKDSRDIEKLIKNGFPVNNRDSMGMTPLMHSASRGNYESCRVLLDNGADLEIVDHEGKSAFDYICVKKGSEIDKLKITKLFNEQKK